MIRLLVRGLPAWTLSIVCCLIILYLTLLPDPLNGNHVSLFEGADKVVHAIMMMGMMMCMAVDALKKRRRTGWMIRCARLRGCLLCI